MAEKSLHPPISTLSHVLRNTGGDYTGNSEHETTLLLGMVTFFRIRYKLDDPE
jgi:hypothetical protein